MLDTTCTRQGRLGAGAGPLIGLSLSLGPGIWRIGPAWAVLAGALASGLPFFVDAMPLKLVGAVILADSAWGVLWRLTASAGDGSSQPMVHPIGLPYYRDQSPLGRMSARLRALVSGAAWHELTAALALTVFLSVLLGMPALLLSVVAWVTIVWAWFLVQAGKRPAACDALLNVGLPWVLGLALAGEGGLSGRTVLPLTGLLPAIAFTILQWGARRFYLSRGRSALGVWLGLVVVFGVLISRQQAVQLAIVAVLLMPPAWWVWRAVKAAAAPDLALRLAGPWWLAAMLLCAFVPH